MGRLYLQNNPYIIHINKGATFYILFLNITGKSTFFSLCQSKVSINHKENIISVNLVGCHPYLFHFSLNIENPFEKKDLYTTTKGDDLNEAIIENNLKFEGASFLRIDKLRIVNLSIKEMEIDEEKKALNKYGSSDSGASLGDILGSVLDKKNNDNA